MKALLTPRVLLSAIAAALGGIAAADIPELNQFDTWLFPVAALLAGWVGLKRPGDNAPAKPVK